MKHAIQFFAAVIILISLFNSLSCDKESSTEIESDPVAVRCIDIHSQPPYPELGTNVNLESIIQQMDDNNVSRSILSARQLMDYSNEIAAFARANPDRIMAAVSLKLNNMETEAEFLNMMNLQIQSGGFRAIAEILLYHAEKFDNQGNSTAPEHRLDVDDNRVHALIQACGQMDCPVFLHIEFASLERIYGTLLRDETMNKLRQLLATYPGQKFIMMHVAELDPQDCRALIVAFGNILFATNFTDLQVHMDGTPVTGYSETDWNDLFEDYSDRFLFAFDRVFDVQWQRYTGDMNHVQQRLADLDNLTAQAIAYDNAVSLFNF